ncbi:energy transducer TonB [Pedobacter glucosidilyticus]|uniref:energy transducer TonB n=1 Tax=Pedobacter glucosidilyticus TaxID=1122941 RepID=UPI00040B6CE5|nr:energy transducer TonB [Pedobacter glucosidilyticus]
MKSLTTIFLLFITINVTAQKRQNIYFLKYNGELVKERDSADFIRVISEPDSGQVFFELIENYKNGKVKRLGYVSSFEPKLILEGYCRDYYPNGNKKEMGFYQKNFKYGEFKVYYPNGVLNEKAIYKMPVKLHMEESHCKIIYFADSLGNSFLDSTGTGHFNIIYRDGFALQGDYLNGLKNGIWKSSNRQDSFTLEEEYRSGQLVQRVRKENDGKSLELFFDVDTVPDFVGGFKAFSDFLSRNLVYPADARDTGKQGRVIMNFIVEKDGTLTEFKIIQSVFPSIDKEALRVLMVSPKWKPGIRSGKPVRVSFNIPIVFKLG